VKIKKDILTDLQKTPWNPDLVNTLHTIKLTEIDSDGLVRFDFVKQSVIV